MNANELADYVDQINTGLAGNTFLNKAATMLRQQQVRIEELQESERSLIGHLNESDVEIEALKEEIKIQKTCSRILMNQIEELLK